METNHSQSNQPDTTYAGADSEEEEPVDAEDVAERMQSDAKIADWLDAHQIRAPGEHPPRERRGDVGQAEVRAVSEVSMSTLHAVGTTSTKPTAADVVKLYRRIASIIGGARGQQYEDMRLFLVPARNYTLDHSERGRDSANGDGGHCTDKSLQDAIEAYPRALAAVERAEADARGPHVVANPGPSGAQVKSAGGASSGGEAAPIDVAGLAPQHPLNSRLQVSREPLSDPIVRPSNNGDSRQHDVDPPAVRNAIAESHDAAPAVPHPGGHAHAGHQDIERLHVMVPRAKIRVGESTQARVAINAEVVESYAEALRVGDNLPPPELVRDDDNDCFWTADGHHRILAHDKLHGDDRAYELEAMVQPGTHRDAVLLAVAANGDHGLQRTNADKRRAVTLLVEDAEWREWSDREIARRCNVGHTLVAEMRRHLFGQAADAETRRFVTKHGTESKMRLKRGQRAADDAHQAGPNPAAIEPAAGDDDTGNAESVLGAPGERTVANASRRATGDHGDASLAAAASEAGGTSPATANGQVRLFSAVGGEGTALMPAEVKPVAPTGRVASAGVGAMAPLEATMLLDEMERVTRMFIEANDALHRLGRQTLSGGLLPRGEQWNAGMARPDMPTPYVDAVRMADKLLDRLSSCEEVFADRIPGELAAPAGMGRPPAKGKLARSRSGPTAKVFSAAKAIQPATAQPGKARKPSLAKTSPKSRVGSKDKQNKKGKTRR
jgi:hypothetical protein